MNMSSLRNTKGGARAATADREGKGYSGPCDPQTERGAPVDSRNNIRDISPGESCSRNSKDGAQGISVV